MSLDDALAGWAATVRLSDAAADEIYQRIVATPATAPAPARRRRAAAAGLDAAWWRSFSADFAATMIDATQPAALAA